MSHVSEGMRDAGSATARSDGLFVVFEGGDGAGKSTQIDLLAEWLEAGGRTVVRTREPGGTQLGRELRSALLHGDDVDPRAEALMYAADRAHHVATVVRPALERGGVVVSDRYIDSSIAYQGAGRGLGPDWIEALSHWGTGGLRPHLTVLLDVDPGTAEARRVLDPDRLERAGGDFHDRVNASFRVLAARDPERYLVLDATRPRERIAAEVRTRVEALLAAAGGGARP